MAVTGRIERISYTPILGSPLQTYSWDELSTTLSRKTAFKVNLDEGLWAISKWVSPKRSRSFPTARVYDTYAIDCKRITIIPIFKDEGKSNGSGDRDFLQWDTISLMSLLNVYVIISYYESAEPNRRFPGKITNQNFCLDHLMDQFLALRKYHSTALHWNMDQTNPHNIREIGDLAVRSYEAISEKLGSGSHSMEKAIKKIDEMSGSRNRFMSISRSLARQAQEREVITTQPKEFIRGKTAPKAPITITNYLGGEYFLTIDEIEVTDDRIYLIEAKGTDKGKFPSLISIKDGLLKMILFTNLSKVYFNNREMKFFPVLKLTTAEDFNEENLSVKGKLLYENLMLEAKRNNFILRIEKHG